MNWLQYLARQAGFSLLTLWFIVSLTFFLRNIAGLHPLEPVFAHAPPAQGSPLQQYLLYLWNAAHFNFGPSLMQVDPLTRLSPPASSLVLQSLPWTLLLVGPGTIISFVLGSFLGVLLAWHRGSALDTWATATVIFITSIPYYFAALVLVFFVTLNVPWFPQHLFIPGLLSSFSPSALGDLARHMILPVTAIVLASVGLYVLPMRNAMVAVMDDDFMPFGAAKGLTSRRLMTAYAVRNAILPVATNLAIQLGYVFGGALFVEIVFEWPGAGYLLYQSMQDEDYPIVQALIVLAATATVVTNFAVRAIYPLLDPRVRRG